MKKMKRPEKWGRKWKIPWILVWSLLICSLSSDISLNFSRPQFPQLEPKACRVLTGAHDGHSDWTILYFPYCPRQGSIFSSPAPLAPSKRQQHSHPCNVCHQHKRKAPTFPSGPERTLEVQPVKPLFFQEKPCSGHRGMTVEPGETSRPRLSTPGPQPLHHVEKLLHWSDDHKDASSPSRPRFCRPPAAGGSAPGRPGGRAGRACRQEPRRCRAAGRPGEAPSWAEGRHVQARTTGALRGAGVHRPRRGPGASPGRARAATGQLTEQAERRTGSVPDPLSGEKETRDTASVSTCSLGYSR